jgi:uncharacterized protein YjbI with pentapeptide repeats
MADTHNKVTEPARRLWGSVPSWLKAIMIGVLVVALAIVMLYWLPMELIKEPRPSSDAEWKDLKDFEAARNNVRIAALQMVGFTVLVFGTAYTIHHNRQTRKIEQYARAGELLSSDHGGGRVAGVYSFEQLSLASTRDHATVVELLAAYIRAQAPEESIKGPGPKQTPADIQSALTVLARRDVKKDPPDDRFRVYLSHTDLRRARLAPGHFDKAHFRHSRMQKIVARTAHLRSANLEEADLNDAKLTGAHLTDANLTGAKLIGADLTGADLTGADLSSADLTEANLTKATLELADLTGAKLSRATFSEATKMRDAVIEEKTLEAAVGYTEQHKQETFTDRRGRDRNLKDPKRRKLAGLMDPERRKRAGLPEAVSDPPEESSSPSDALDALSSPSRCLTDLPRLMLDSRPRFRRRRGVHWV